MTLTITGTAHVHVRSAGSSDTDELSTLHVTRTVPELTEAEAPVVAIAVTRSGNQVEYRWVGGAFYRQYISRERAQALTRARFADALSVTRHFDTSDGAEQILQSLLAKFIIIDGSAWFEMQEPAFIIDSIAFSISVGDPCDAAPWRVYSLKEYGAARAEAIRRRTAKGIKDDLPLSLVESPGTITLPEAFTGPLHAERVKAVPARAAAAAEEAIAKLQNLNEESLTEAADILIKAARDFKAGNSGSRWPLRPYATGLSSPPVPEEFLGRLAAHRHDTSVIPPEIRENMFFRLNAGDSPGTGEASR